MSTKTNRRLPEANYIPLARKALEATLSRKQAQASEKDAKRVCAQAMHSVSVKDFAFNVENKRYRARLARPTTQHVCVQKLYTAVRNQEVTLDEFLSIVTPDDTAVLNRFGKDFYDRVSTYDRGPLGLFFNEVKGK